LHSANTKERERERETERGGEAEMTTAEDANWVFEDDGIDVECAPIDKEEEERKRRDRSLDAEWGTSWYSKNRKRMWLAIVNGLYVIDQADEDYIGSLEKMAHATEQIDTVIVYSAPSRYHSWEYLDPFNPPDPGDLGPGYSDIERKLIEYNSAATLRLCITPYPKSDNAEIVYFKEDPRYERALEWFIRAMRVVAVTHSKLVVIANDSQSWRTLNTLNRHRHAHAQCVKLLDSGMPTRTRHIRDDGSEIVLDPVLSDEQFTECIRLVSLHEYDGDSLKTIADATDAINLVYSKVSSFLLQFENIATLLVATRLDHPLAFKFYKTQEKANDAMKASEQTWRYVGSFFTKHGHRSKNVLSAMIHESATTQLLKKQRTDKKNKKTTAATKKKKTAHAEPVIEKLFARQAKRKPESSSSSKRRVNLAFESQWKKKRNAREAKAKKKQPRRGGAQPSITHFYGK